MVRLITKQSSLSKASWLAALLCAVLISTAALGSSSAPQAAAGPDGSAGGLSGSGGQLWHQDSAGIEGVAETSDEFGSAVAHGDFNGDGVEDLAVGVFREDLDDAVNTGAVNIIYGSDSGLTATGDQVWRQGSNGVNGVAEADDAFGRALASGDFDDDGFDDLAIGASREDIGDIENAGSVNILYGSSGGLTAAGDQLWTQATGILGVVEEDDFFGGALASGDFDGDGFADLAIGVSGEDIGDVVDAGAINIIYGSSGGLTAAGDQLWDQGTGILGLVEADDRFGRALASGDFDNDGFDDLAVGVFGEDIGSAEEAGAVNVLYGSGAGLTDVGDQIWDQGAGILGAVESGDNFGWALASGDFDDDGYADLAVGVPQEDIGSTLFAGAVNVIYGSAGGLSEVGDQLWDQGAGILGAVESGDNFGWALASGDFDDDGYADLAVGVPGEDIEDVVAAGAVNVIHGSAAGLTSVGDQLWHQSNTGIFGAVDEPVDRFGGALTSGDFDGDGYADLAVGADNEDIGDIVDAGAVYVLYASGAAPTATPTHTPTPIVTPTDTPPPDKEVGDVNSDGLVNAIDAALILQFNAGIIGSVPNPSSADVNGDGIVNTIDALLILQFDAGFIDSLLP